MRIASSFTGCGTSSAMSGVCSPTMTCPLTSKLTRTTTLPVTIDPFPCSCTVRKYSWGFISDFCKSACCPGVRSPHARSDRKDKSLASAKPFPLAFGSDVISLPIGALSGLEDFPSLESFPPVTTACSLLVVSDSMAFGTAHSRRALDVVLLAFKL